MARSSRRGLSGCHTVACSGRCPDKMERSWLVLGREMVLGGTQIGTKAIDAVNASLGRKR